jgi:SSS family solute:Na+ symporter
MLTTSLSQDLYKRFIAPGASEPRVLAVARWATVAAGFTALTLALTAASIITLLTIFYTLLTVSLFVPIVSGLLVARATTRDALASIFAGVSVMLIIQFATHGRGWGLITPALGGLVAAGAAWALSFSTGAMHVVVVSNRRHRR